jgi:hypothetical protein
MWFVFSSKSDETQHSDIQHNDTQHSEKQYNNTQHKNCKHDSQHSAKDTICKKWHSA